MKNILYSIGILSGSSLIVLSQANTTTINPIHQQYVGGSKKFINTHTTLKVITNNVENSNSIESLSITSKTPLTNSPTRIYSANNKDITTRFGWSLKNLKNSLKSNTKDIEKEIKKQEIGKIILISVIGFVVLLFAGAYFLKIWKFYKANK